MRSRALVRSRGLEPIVFVGGSMGGVVAQHLVLRHPPRVSRLLLVATGAVHGGSGRGAGKSRRARLVRLVTRNSQSDR